MASIALSDLLSLDMLMDVRESDDCRHRGAVERHEHTAGGHAGAAGAAKTLADGIASLQKNEQIVLSLYYEKNLHMKEIAQVMNLSGPAHLADPRARDPKAEKPYGAVLSGGYPPCQ